MMQILGITEVQAMEFIRGEPFDVCVALPGERSAASAPRPLMRLHPAAVPTSIL